MNRIISQLAVFATLVASLAAGCLADEGDPIAIIRLAGGGVAIETMWNHSVVITDSSDDLTSRIPGVDVFRGDPIPSRKTSDGRFVVAGSEPFDYVLDRPANQPVATWKRSSQAGDLSGNAIRVRSVSTAILVEVDGARILHIIAPLPQFKPEQRQLMEGCDLLILAGEADTKTEPRAIAQMIAAKRVVVSTNYQSDTAQVVPGNTIAINASRQPADLQVLALGHRPIDLSSELTDLINRKESACRASQQVFEKLSIKQLNFRPSNGSHTPRWNAEHMMGRELLFFSQIFHAQDDSIAVMDLNPKQMPPDYVAKHPDWTGMEEAMQMERVSAFTRRFAYLLHDLPLDRKPPGSRWTPRALLLQMERHYNEHTANVKKKFALPDWPAQ